MMTSVIDAISQTYTEVKEAVMGAPEDEPKTKAGVKTRRVEQENTETNEASGAEPKQSKKQKKPKQPAGHEPSSDQSTAAFGPEPNPALKPTPESAPESGPEEPEEPEEIFRLTDEEFARLSQAQHTAGSWVRVLGGPIDAMRQASAALSNLDRTGTEAQIQEWSRQVGATTTAFNKIKQTVGKNLEILAPQAVQANARAADLQEMNEQLQAERRTASEAAQEAASKLQQTQVALHQSAAGHSNIASAFPLSTEIADKVATFGADGFAELVLDHALAAAPDLLAATDDLRVLLQCASATVLQAKERVEQGVFAALYNVPRSKLIDGFFRQIWQEQHRHLMNTDDISKLLEALAQHEPKHGSWHMNVGGDELRPCLEKMMRTLLQLYVYTTVCDPPLKLDPNFVGRKTKFNPAYHNAMDESIKPGAPCVVIFPPLLSESDDLKAKAQVLAKDYK